MAERSKALDSNGSRTSRAGSNPTAGLSLEANWHSYNKNKFPLYYERQSSETVPWVSTWPSSGQLRGLASLRGVLPCSSQNPLAKRALLYPTIGEGLETHPRQ